MIPAAAACARQTSPIVSKKCATQAKLQLNNCVSVQQQPAQITSSMMLRVNSAVALPVLPHRYFTPVTLAPGFAVCGNSRYAQAYLSPLTANPLPPTMPTLRSVYVNPLSASTPAFLASFQAKCGDRGLGFLGGDPNLLSVYHVKYFQKVCFAPGGVIDRMVMDRVRGRIRHAHALAEAF